MNKLNELSLNQVLNHDVMNRIVGGTHPNDFEKTKQNTLRGLEEERRRFEREQQRVALGKGLYLGGDDLIEYEKGNHKIGYTPNRITYTKSVNCVIL
jgi:hypothetical protein